MKGLRSILALLVTGLFSTAHADGATPSDLTANADGFPQTENGELGLWNFRSVSRPQCGTFFHGHPDPAWNQSTQN